MSCVHEFITNFEAMDETVLGSLSAVDEPTVIETSEEETRNVCFVWANGRQAFFNYAYLVTGEFDPLSAPASDPVGDKNVILLRFAVHEVSLFGYGLAALFSAFLDHRPRLVRAVDPRYALTRAVDQPTVVDIQVKSDGD